MHFRRKRAFAASVDRRYLIVISRADRDARIRVGVYRNSGGEWRSVFAPRGRSAVDVVGDGSAGRGPVQLNVSIAGNRRRIGRSDGQQGYFNRDGAGQAADVVRLDVVIVQRAGSQTRVGIRCRVGRQSRNNLVETRGRVAAKYLYALVVCRWNLPCQADGGRG